MRLDSIFQRLPSLGLMTLAVLGASSASARELSLEERIAHQRAIEEVYWRHRTWPVENSRPKPPLSEVLPDEAIRAKVEDYLEKSCALEKSLRPHPR